MENVNYDETPRQMSEMNADGQNEKKRSSRFLYTLSFFAAIGGFLFGYDTGVISGAMLLLKDEFSLDSFSQEIIVSVTIASAIVFSLVSGFLNAMFGRKATTLIGSVVFTAGAVILGVAQNTMMLIIGRGILGIGIGKRTIYAYLKKTYYGTDTQFS
jgi:SP family myo-inositol transporter-like MFS transporter 13